MSEENTSPSGQADQQSSGESVADQQNPTSGSDKVAYETYKKVLSEKKARDTQLSELQNQLEQLQNEKLQKEGNTQELLDRYKTQSETFKSELEQTKRAYARATLSGQVKTEAVKLGCQDPETLIKILDLDNIPVDPTSFSADADNIKMLLEETKKSRPYFFGKPAPNVSDVSQQPTNYSQGTSSSDLKSKSREELQAMARGMTNEKIF